MCLDSVEVVRMNLRSTVSHAPLVESDPEILERNSVRIQALGVGSQDADKLGHEIQNLAKFCFLFVNPFLGQLPCGDVGYRPDELTLARCALYDASDRVDMLNPPVRQ